MQVSVIPLGSSNGCPCNFWDMFEVQVIIKFIFNLVTRLDFVNREDGGSRRNVGGEC